MTELFLDGMPAVISQSANFKLTMENFYFTKSSSYTFDVELPLRVPQNRRIFGNIDRIDIPKEPRTFAARLVVDNKTLLVGTAKLTSVSESSVKLQLLGDAAAYNYGNKVDGLYIDQMDLGDWYRETWPDGSYFARGRGDTGEWKYKSPETVTKAAQDLYFRAQYKGPEFGNQKFSGTDLFNRYLDGNLGWVAYPTYGDNCDVRFNQVAFQLANPDSEESPIFFPFIRYYEGKTSEFHYEVDYLTEAFAVQPMIWKLAEIIAKRTGFTLAREDNALYTDSFFKMIFCVNCSTSALCNKCLPHWTVNEWWEQVENTFGLVQHIDYVNMKMKLLRRCDFYAQTSKVEITNIVDQFEASLDDNSQTDISISSVGFADYDNNPEDIIDEEVLANVRYMDFDSISDMKSWGLANVSTIYQYKDVIFRCATEERFFIYSTNADLKGDEGFIEVNMLRPRIVDTDDSDEEQDVDIELKIVPARYSVQKADLYFSYKVASQFTPGIVNDSPLGSFDARMLQIPGPDSAIMWGSTKPGVVERDLSIDLQAVVEDNEDYEVTSESTSDLLYMGIINPDDWDDHNESIKLTSGKTATGNFRYPVALLRNRCMVPFKFTEVSFDGDNHSLSLNQVADQINLYSATIEDMTVIHTDVRHCFKFIADSIPDTGAVFNIRNRLFVCEKIEANIKPDGLDKLLTGYFYELKN